MTKRIDHSGHPHPSTPAARARCRAAGGTGRITTDTSKSNTSDGKKPKTGPTAVNSATRRSMPMTGWSLGDRVRFGFRTGQIVQFVRRPWGQVAVVLPERIQPGDGTYPHEVPVTHLQRIIDR